MSELAPSRLAAAPMTYRSADIRFVRREAKSPGVTYKLLMLFLILLYSNIARLVPSLDAVRPAQLIAVIAIVALVAERSLMRQGFEMVWPESYLLLAFLAAAGFSSLGALWSGHAAQTTLDLAKMIAVYFLLVNTVDSVDRLRGVIWVMVLGGLFPAVGALHGYLNGDVVEGRAHWRGTFGNPNELGYSLVILVPLAVALAAELRPALRLLVWAAIPFYLAAIFLTFSRGAMIGLLVTLGWTGLRQKSPVFRLAMVAVLCAALVFMAFWWTRGQGFGDLSGDTNLRQRFGTIRAGMGMFFDRPLFGVGIGCSVIAWPLYAPPDVYSGRPLHIHNTFMQALAETGIFGFLPFTLLIAMAVYHARQLWRAPAVSPEQQRLAALTAAVELSLWGFIICGLSGGFVLSWFPYILLGLVSAAVRVAARDSAGSEVSRFDAARLMKSVAPAV